MKLKTVLLSVSAAALTLSMSSAFAGLTLCSQNYPNAINTSCNGKAGVAIPASTGTTNCASDFGVSDLPWAALFGKFKSKNFTCTFTDAATGEQLGSADVSINVSLSSTGEITNQHVASGLTLAGGPFGSQSGEVKATIVKN